MDALRSLLCKIILYPGSALIVLLSPLAAWAGQRALTIHVHVWARYYDWCVRHILGVRYRIDGTIPSGAVLVAMKHEAIYETIEALIILDRPAIVFKRELMDVPIWGRVCQRYGGIVVDRDAGAKSLRAMLANAKALIADGRPVLLFPEGTRTPRGEQPELKAGLAGLYRLLNLPVVPIACDSGRLFPKGGPARSGLVTFRVGETIPAGLPREEIEARVHAAINVLNPITGD